MLNQRFMPCSTSPQCPAAMLLGYAWTLQYRTRHRREWVLTLSTAAALAIALGLRLCHLVLPTMQTIAVALSSTGAR